MLDPHDLTPSDAKSAAKRISTALKAKRIDLSHGECLDVLARLFGLENWNVMAAQLGAKLPPPSKVDVPDGWYLTGRSNYGYTGGIDKAETHRGQSVFFLRNERHERGTAALGQFVSAKPYAGKRVRYSAWLRCENVLNSAGISIFITDDRDHVLDVRGLETRTLGGSLKATTGWSQRDIVIDIPDIAHELQFGFYLYGTGEARFSGIALEVVGNDVPTSAPQAHDTPQNLDFSRPRG
jgi:hypothetical protein